MIQGDILHISFAAIYKGCARYDSVKMRCFKNVFDKSSSLKYTK